MFIRALPAAVLYTIGASLLVALTIIPFLASRLLSRDAHATEGNAALRALTGGIHRVYGPALRRALAWPRTTLLAAAAVFGTAVALVPVIGFSLFPSADTPQFTVDIEAPDGASLAATDRALSFVESDLAQRAEVRYWFANLGHDNPFIYYNVTPRETRANVAQVLVELSSYDTRSTPKLLDELRAKFNAYPAARITVKNFENGPQIAAPIAIRVSGPDLDKLRELAADVERVIRATPARVTSRIPCACCAPISDLTIDTDKATLLGVPAAAADRTVRLRDRGLRG